MPALLSPHRILVVRGLRLSWLTGLTGLTKPRTFLAAAFLGGVSVAASLTVPGISVADETTGASTESSAASSTADAIAGSSAESTGGSPAAPQTGSVQSDRSQPAPLEIQLVPATAERPAEFTVSGLSGRTLQRLKERPTNSPELAEILRVTVWSETVDPQIPALSGRYRIDADRLVFVPRYPPKPGLSYRVTVTPAREGNEDTAAPLVARLTAPAPSETADRAPTQIVQIYPTTDELPENHLRFYLHFSAPMARAQAYDHLQLLDEHGEVLDASFLELGEELWDPTRQRFTLLLDPGRIKRGLKPREELGPVLEAGHRYTLVVRRTWEDAHGHTLAADYRKTFLVGPPAVKGLDPAAWQITPPPAGTRQPLIVDFPGPLDHALLERVITVQTADHRSLPGVVSIGPREQQWRFTPEMDWQSGTCRLIIDTVLEDSAGNRIGRPFEVDEIEPVTQRVVAEFVELKFEVAGDTNGLQTKAAP